MHVPPTGTERRTQPRVAIHAAAVVIRDRVPLGLYLVENLSASGALLVGGPSLKPGEAVRVVLRVPRRRPLTVHAVVARDHRDDEAPGVGVAFRQVPSDVQDAITELVTRGLQHRSAAEGRTVLVAATDGQPRAALAAELTAWGHLVVTAVTPRTDSQRGDPPAPFNPASAKIAPPPNNS